MRPIWQQRHFPVCVHLLSFVSSILKMFQRVPLRNNVRVSSLTYRCFIDRVRSHIRYLRSANVPVKNVQTSVFV